MFAPTIDLVHCPRWVARNNVWKNRLRCVNEKKKREKKAVRQRKIDDRVREYVYHAATVSNSFSFQTSVPKRPKKRWKSFVS